MMQPYSFPYLGYFQLIHSVDLFISYDTVQFVKQSWMNRNRILINSEPRFITVPIHSPTTSSSIREIQIAKEYSPKKLFKSIQYNYSSQSGYAQSIELIKEVLFYKADSLADFNEFGLKRICEFLDIRTPFVNSSSLFSYKSEGMDRLERLFFLLEKTNATVMHNAIGGEELYDKRTFSDRGFSIKFINSALPSIDGHADEGHGSLSIFHWLLTEGRDFTIKALKNYTLK